MRQMDWHYNPVTQLQDDCKLLLIFLLLSYQKVFTKKDYKAINEANFKEADVLLNGAKDKTGKILSEGLETKLKRGVDIAEVTSKSLGKNLGSLFKSELKEDNITKGKELLYSYCKSKNIVLSDLTKPEYMEVTMRKYGFRDWDSVCAAVGHGGLKEGQVINRLQEEQRKTERKNITDAQVLESISETKENRTPATAKSKSGIVVKGIHDVAVRFSKCCSPVPGDEIVGFVTRGRGVSLHRTDCVNVINLPVEERARLIDAEWSVPERDKGELYETEIRIFTVNRMGLLADISKTFTENKIDVMSMNVRTTKKESATIQVGFEINGKEHLATVINKLRMIDGVIDIERATG